MPMSFPQHVNTFLRQFSLRNMKGEDVYVVIVFFLAKGKRNVMIRNSSVKSSWSKTLIGKSYNPSFAHRAQGHVDSSRKGSVHLTAEGVEYVESLMTTGIQTGLTIFKKGTTHSFDKFLRSILKESKSSVLISDPYVAGNVFDNLLDEIPKRVPIKFLYKTDTGGFVSKKVRFAGEFNFQCKESREFHDRFLIIDGRGYLLGPSLKDAADKKPATLVVLSESDSKKLQGLFSDLWR